MIEERVEAILAERIFCRDCVYWEALAHQEDSSRVNGVCHYVPALPQRKATDWCSKGEKA